MTGSIVTIEVSGVKYLLDSSVETMKILHGTSVLAGTAQSMLDGTTGADYVVTVGKTFTALGCFIMGVASGGSLLFYQGDSADAITVLKATLVCPSTTISWERPLNFTVAASKYVTLDPSGANAATDVIVVGFES